MGRDMHAAAVCSGVSIATVASSNVEKPALNTVSPDNTRGAPHADA